MLDEIARPFQNSPIDPAVLTMAFTDKVARSEASRRGECNRERMPIRAYVNTP